MLRRSARQNDMDLLVSRIEPKARTTIVRPVGPPGQPQHLAIEGFGCLQVGGDDSGVMQTRDLHLWKSNRDGGLSPRPSRPAPSLPAAWRLLGRPSTTVDPRLLVVGVSGKC